MEFSIATLLAQFVDDKLVAGKNLEKKTWLRRRRQHRKIADYP